MKPLSWEWLGRTPTVCVWRCSASPARCSDRWHLTGDALAGRASASSRSGAVRYRADEPDRPRRARGRLPKVERGGLATYHGPGQLVAYAIVDCWRRGIGARGAVHAMEQVMIDWLDTMHGLQAPVAPACRRVGRKQQDLCRSACTSSRGVDARRRPQSDGRPHGTTTALCRVDHGWRRHKPR